MNLGVTRIAINSQIDTTLAAVQAREYCAKVGFDENSAYLISTAVSELATNIIKYAVKGEVILKAIDHEGNDGIQVEANDDGPGIADVDEALEDGFSSSGTLGFGLPGVKRMMDEFSVESSTQTGTRVKARKWLK